MKATICVHEIPWSVATSFNKETSKLVSQRNTKIGFLPAQNHEDIYI